MELHLDFIGDNTAFSNEMNCTYNEQTRGDRYDLMAISEI